MIASVGMTVCKRAATPTALHVIAENSMTCIMSVVQSVRSAVMPQSAARRPTTTSTSVDSDIHIGRQRHPHRPMRMDRGKQKSPRESRREASNKQLFFVPAKAGLFERPKAAFFYRHDGWRQAVHDGGDGGDDTEGNSFSDWRNHQPHQGEADSRRHGFLCLCHSLIVAINGG